MSLFDDFCHKKNSSLVHIACSPFILKGKCQRRMIYITNQFYASVIAYVTITSNHMTVPITFSQKNTILSYIYHMLYLHFRSCISRKNDIFYIIGLFPVSVVITCVTTVTPYLMISENHE